MLCYALDIIYFDCSLDCMKCSWYSQHWSGLPVTTSCLYLTTGFPCLVIKPSLWLAWWPGTSYMTVFVIQHVCLTVFNVI